MLFIRQWYGWKKQRKHDWLGRLLTAADRQLYPSRGGKRTRHWARLGSPLMRRDLVQEAYTERVRTRPFGRAYLVTYHS